MEKIDWYAIRESLIVIVAILVMSLLLLLIADFIPTYYSACRQVDFYNKLHQTNYSCSDFFWAGEQINRSTVTVNQK